MATGVFVKSFKGYEDKLAELDAAVNGWLASHAADVLEVVNIRTALSHEHGGRAGSGDLIYTIIYRAAKALA